MLDMGDEGQGAVKQEMQDAAVKEESAVNLEVCVAQDIADTPSGKQ